VRTDAVDFVVADVPGLIEGASSGRGLGLSFLRHVERAGVLVHVLDCATYEQRDPRDDLRTVLAELRAYAQAAGLPELLERPSLVFLNKIDAGADTAEIVRDDIAAEGFEVLEGSAVTGAGLDRLRRRMADLVVLARQQRSSEAAEAIPRPVLRPAGRDSDDIRVERRSDGWQVRSDRVERWVVMTDLDNPDAVAYLQGRMLRGGVERELLKAGARRGDPVQIAGALFDFEPAPDGAADEDDVDP